MSRGPFFGLSESFLRRRHDSPFLPEHHLRYGHPAQRVRPAPSTALGAGPASRVPRWSRRWPCGNPGPPVGQQQVSALGACAPPAQPPHGQAALALEQDSGVMPGQSGPPCRRRSPVGCARTRLSAPPLPRGFRSISRCWRRFSLAPCLSVLVRLCPGRASWTHRAVLSFRPFLHGHGTHWLTVQIVASIPSTVNKRQQIPIPARLVGQRRRAAVGSKSGSRSIRSAGCRFSAADRLVVLRKGLETALVSGHGGS